MIACDQFCKITLTVIEVSNIGVGYSGKITLVLENENLQHEEITYCLEESIKDRQCTPQWRS
jgi:hypothetical protein